MKWADGLSINQNCPQTIREHGNDYESGSASDHESGVGEYC